MGKGVGKVAPKNSRESGTSRNPSVSKEARASREPKAAGQARTARGAREAQRSKRQAKRARAEKPAPRIRFGRRSQILFGAGGLSIAVGYFSLASGSITLAPILLVAGYCVFFPMGILLKEGLGAQRGGE
jgi:hypothetical protein